MPLIKTVGELVKVKDNLKPAETAKIAGVRPTTRFEVATPDNPDMINLLAKQKIYVQEKLTAKFGDYKAVALDALKPEIDKYISEFQKILTEKAYNQQQGLLAALKKHGIPFVELVEDKGHIEAKNDKFYFDLIGVQVSPEVENESEEKKTQFGWFTDQIFATDTGQYFTKDGVLYFIHAKFKNQQRQGEEDTAIAQAISLGAVIVTLEVDGEKPVFEGGDIRQMPGKDLFFIGAGHRTMEDACAAIAEVSGFKVLPIQLLKRQFYHLDCCFLPLPNDSAVIYEGKYEKDRNGELIYDENGWPKIVPGTETMAPESRALIRTIYPQDKLVLITKKEALAFATNAALLQDKDGRFKLFVNGRDRETTVNDETAIKEHKLSFSHASFNRIIELTTFIKDGVRQSLMDIVEVPYDAMHCSGGSIRCTIQEIACTPTIQQQIMEKKFFSHGSVNRFDAWMTQRAKEKDKNEFFKDYAEKELPGNQNPLSAKLDKFESNLAKKESIMRGQAFFKADEPKTENQHSAPPSIAVR